MIASPSGPVSHRDYDLSESSYLGSFNEPLQTRAESLPSLSSSIAFLSVSNLSDSSPGDFCEIDKESSCYDFDDDTSISIESTYRDLYKELPVQVIALSPERSKKTTTLSSLQPVKRRLSTHSTQCTSTSLSSSAANSLAEVLDMGSPTEPTSDEQIIVQLPPNNGNQYTNKVEITHITKQARSSAIRSKESLERVDKGTLLANLQREIAKTQDRINAIRAKRMDGDSASTDLLQKPVANESKNSPLTQHSGTHIGSTDNSSSRSEELHVFKEDDNDDISLHHQKQIQANRVHPDVKESSKKPSDMPPMNEVLVMVDCKSNSSCDSGDLKDDADGQLAFLTNKLEAADDLMDSLFKELQEAQDENMVLKHRNVELNRLIETMKDGKGVNTEEFELLMEQCVMLKYAIVVGLAFYVCGQTEIFLACVVFLWMSLVVVTKDT